MPSALAFTCTRAARIANCTFDHVWRKMPLARAEQLEMMHHLDNGTQTLAIGRYSSRGDLLG